MSRIDYLEGRRHAARIVEAACASSSMFYGRNGVRVVVDNLRAAMVGRPAAFAAGVESFIDAVKIEGGVSV